MTTTRKDLWSAEFGSEYTPDPKVLALVEQGMARDDSWHNDICPSFSRLEGRVLLWADAADPKQRELRGPRYQVYMVVEGTVYDAQVEQRDIRELYDGDSTDDAIAAFLKA